MNKCNSSPRVTVLMSAYNGEEHIRDAIRSVLAQSFGDFRLLIIDDASSDGTGEIIRGFNDSRISCIRNEKNLGLAMSLNRGLDLIDTEFVVRMDCDDTCHPKRIEWQVAFMEAHPECGMSGSWLRTFGVRGQRGLHRYPESFEQIKLRMLFKSPVAHATLVMRNSLLREYGVRYDPKFTQTEDFDLCQRASRHFTILNLPRTAYYYRRHEDCKTIRNHAVLLREVRTIISRQLESLNLHPNPEELDLHCRICVGRGAQSQREMSIARDWFKLLKSRLIASSEFDAEDVERSLAASWFDFCRYSALVGLPALWAAYGTEAVGRLPFSLRRDASFALSSLLHGIHNLLPSVLTESPPSDSRDASQ